MINTDKKLKITTTVFFICLAVMTAIILISGFGGKAVKDNNITNGSQNGYVLKEYNGKIAAFYGNNSVPIEVFEVDFYSLPASDRLLLQKGIKADNLKKIYQFAEDFDG